MAHLLVPELVDKPKKKKRFTFRKPQLTGKYGISLMLGKYEVFIGIGVAEILVERIVRKKKMKVFPKNTKVRYLDL